jgi:peptidoglycan/xylan/chitin deacetylase (PgdA/CDA1 family)
MHPVITLHHHIGREGPFEQGLGIATSQDAFDKQIERLARDYDIIDLDTLLSGRLPRRPLLLTFDDTYRSILDAAKRVLAQRGLPGLVFLNPGILGAESLSLDQTLAWATGKAGLAEVCRALGLPVVESLGALVVGTMAGFGSRARADIKERLIVTFGPLDLTQRLPLLTTQEVAEFAGLGLEIGNHTMTHVHCRALSAEERVQEIVEAKLKLEVLSGRPVRAFSVPYGSRADLTTPVLEAARQSGHQAIFLVHARSNARRPAPDIWYRTSLHEETPHQLRMKLVVLPAMRSLRQRISGRL